MKKNVGYYVHFFLIHTILFWHVIRWTGLLTGDQFKSMITVVYKYLKTAWCGSEGIWLSGKTLDLTWLDLTADPGIANLIPPQAN